MSKFERNARLWQSRWHKRLLKDKGENKVGYYIRKREKIESYNLLSEKNAKEGYNFYDGFGIRDAVEKDHPKAGLKFNDVNNIYQNLLRSEHIPFNMFIPLYENEKYLKNVFNHILDETISDSDKGIRENIKIREILDFKIEHKPKLEKNDVYLDGKKPKKEDVYLNDNTSFDAYIEYISEGKGKCIIGIEIKYTEPCSTYKKPEKRIPRYKDVTDGTRNDGSRTYKDSFKEIEKKLKDKNYNKKYNQLWRNHMLGESILQSKLQKDKDFRDFISITIYPKENKHISEAINYGEEFLKDEYRYTSLFFTYEDLFYYIEEHCKEDHYKNWIKWMRERYLVKDDEIREICQIQ
jgi:hypothetical protein